MSDSVTFLGTSDGHPSADRQNTSLLVRFGGQTILIDCGQPCSHTLTRMGIDANTIDAVFLTHAHSDHIGGLPMLMQSLWLGKRTRPLPLHLPPGIIAPLRSWLRSCFLYEENFQFQPQWQRLAVGSPMTVGAVTGNAFPTQHLEKSRVRFAAVYPEVKFEAYCFRFETHGKRFAFSGDLGAPEDLAAVCAEPLDLLVVELAHFPPAKLAAFLQDKPIAHVALTHFSGPVLEKIDEVRNLFARTIPHARVSYVRDGDVIEF